MRATFRRGTCQFPAGVQKSQRAAWRFSDEKNQEIVFETGIYNLTKDETKCLVHFGADNTQTWTMIRLPPPEEEANE